MGATRATNQDLEPLQRELASVRSELKLALEVQLLKLTIRLGLMLFLGLGLTIAVLRLVLG